MGRPPLAVGTAGDIMTTSIDGGWKARQYIRDADGRRREVARWRPTKAAAVAAVKEAMLHRSHADESTELGPDSTVATLAAAWLDQIDESGKAVNTKAAYRGAVDNHIGPALGGLRLREVSVPRVHRALRSVNDRAGTGAAKMMRSALSGMFGMAAQHGAIASNPVRDSGRLERTTRKTSPRALTIEEQWRVMDVPRTSKRAVDLDLPDLIDWMLGTGMRIGEACAVRERALTGAATRASGDVLLDLEAGTFEVNATVVRVTGAGLVVQERTKTEAGWRVLALPPDLVGLVRRRREELRVDPPAVVDVLVDRDRRQHRNPGMVLYSPAGHLRDPRNTNRDLRALLDGIDCVKCEGTGYKLAGDGSPKRDARGNPVRCDAGPFAWVTSHVFRKTVATRMEEAGCTPREVADQLGHSRPSMTQDVYFGRNVVTAKAATILTRPARAATA